MMRKKQTSIPLTPQIELLLSQFESEAAIARTLNLSTSAINFWVRKGYVPPLHAIKIEEITNGRIKAKDLINPNKKGC
jgi:DNA-binding transcriptional regulator YdaS (Cro superfamily)